MINLLESLTERAKELTCLYAIEEALKEPDADIDRVCERIIEAIPPGWQYPDICVAEIILEGIQCCRSPNFEETPWHLKTDIVQQDHVVGSIGVYYTKEMPPVDIGPFLNDEQKLIESIADRLNHFVIYKKMQHVLQEWRNGKGALSETGRADWEAVLDLVRQTDHALFLRIANKMLNHLCWSGIEEAETLRPMADTQKIAAGNLQDGDVEGPRLSRLLDFSAEFTERLFRIAANNLSGEEILSRIQMWIQEDKIGALHRTVRRRLPLSEVSSRLRHYFFTTRDESYDRYPVARGLKVLLIESVLSDRLEYIDAAKDHVDIDDLYHLLQKVIFSADSHGKLGGKSAGLILASQILKKTNGGGNPAFRFPKTWYISSDMMLESIHYNNMDEVIEQKYKDIERVRLEYPHVIEMFQKTVLPPEMVNGLSAALDDLGENPIVVRSSSLLEDRTGAPFVGLYKSVFLGNQGPREERLRRLISAVTEVYASNFGPDPIEFRAARDLLELSEQMGIMIQQVVGERVGPYFLPVYSGVASSRMGFRWLPDVAEDSGIVRIMPGLGTGALRRNREEHPVLVIPGHPSAAVYGSSEERICEAPSKIDVINLETNSIETIKISELMTQYGSEFPLVEQIMSEYKDGELLPVSPAENPFSLENQRLVVTFDGLLTRSPFVAQIRTLLRTLEEELGSPVEVEFASDGKHLHILQCRTQTPAGMPRPAPIPKELTRNQLVFSTRRFVSNGRASNITHTVYVDPESYASIEDPADRGAITRIVSRLNELLPKRQFALIWPDRFATHRDEGGASICHRDFDNAAALIELSEPEEENSGKAPVGLHVLHDLAESGVLYLPLTPGDEGTTFNERFLRRSRNVFPELFPEYAHLADVVHVVDVPKVTDGKVLQVLMNAELGEAVGLLSDPGEKMGYPEEREPVEDGRPEDYWRWRHRMAEQIAGQLDPVRFGVERIYLFGSTKNGTAGPGSDIDILVHFKGTKSQRELLVQWLEGWSLCLDEINYLRTGYRAGGLLDFHIITDKDIAKKTSYAVKINAVTDAARPLNMKETSDDAR